MYRIAQIHSAASTFTQGTVTYMLERCKLFRFEIQCFGSFDSRRLLVVMFYAGHIKSYGNFTFFLFNSQPPGGRIRPPRFFLNNVRSVTGIDAKLDIPFRTSI